MKRLTIEQSDHEEYTPYSGVALVGLCLRRYTSLEKRLDKVEIGRFVIPNSTVVKCFLGNLCLGKSDYEAVEDLKEDLMFQAAFDIEKMPSSATLRQRLDDQAGEFEREVRRAVLEFLTRADIPITGLETGHIPLDIDVTPLDNSGTRKEGVSRTYKGYDGYAPIFAYLGHEGWCINAQLREGKEHGQADFIPFLKETLARCAKVTRKKILVRLDAAHDAIETLFTLRNSPRTSFIVKWNPRRSNVQTYRDLAFSKGRIMEEDFGKRVAIASIKKRFHYKGKTGLFRLVLRVTERTIDRRGQQLAIPDITLEGWWTSLDLPEETIIRLYEDHGLSEQYHSEIKTDLDLERLPSGKFATNSLILLTGTLAYNILRYIGQKGLIGKLSPIRHPAKRRRVRTVIQELIYLAARLVRTARRIKLRFGKHCPGFLAFQDLYFKLCPA